MQVTPREACAEGFSVEMTTLVEEWLRRHQAGVIAPWLWIVNGTTSAADGFRRDQQQSGAKACCCDHKWYLRPALASTANVCATLPSANTSSRA